MNELWEILVPTQMNNHPTRTAHHKEWDKVVRSISGGLTILTPARGQWVHQNKLFEERMIPVRIACTEKQINRIIDFTIKHYNQLAVLAYRISDKVILKHKA